MQVQKRLTTDECAEFINRTPGSVRRLVMRNAIPHRKVHGRLMFLSDELEQWIQNSPGATVDEALKK